MLPLPFKNFVPKQLYDSLDQAGNALCSLSDLHIAEWLTDIRRLGKLFSPDLCSPVVLNELAYFVGFDPNLISIQTIYLVDENGDYLIDESGNILVETNVYSQPQGENPTKRIGIYEATKSYKNWLLFEDHIQPLVESITNFPCVIFRGAYLVDESGDYLVDELGKVLTDLPSSNDYIFIDIGGGGVLTADTIALVMYNLKKYCNLAYLQINVGHVVSGVFYSYDII